MNDIRYYTLTMFVCISLFIPLEHVEKKMSLKITTYIYITFEIMCVIYIFQTLYYDHVSTMKCAYICDVNNANKNDIKGVKRVYVGSDKYRI